MLDLQICSHIRDSHHLWMVQVETCPKEKEGQHYLAGKHPPILHYYQKVLWLQAGQSHGFIHDCPWPSPVKPSLAKWKGGPLASPHFIFHNMKPINMKAAQSLYYRFPLYIYSYKLQWYKSVFLHIGLLSGKFKESRICVSLILRSMEDYH